MDIMRPSVTHVDRFRKPKCFPSNYVFAERPFSSGGGHNPIISYCDVQNQSSTGVDLVRVKIAQIGRCRRRCLADFDHGRCRRRLPVFLESGPVGLNAERRHHSLKRSGSSRGRRPGCNSVNIFFPFGGRSDRSLNIAQVAIRVVVPGKVW